MNRRDAESAEKGVQDVLIVETWPAVTVDPTTYPRGARYRLGSVS
jgi:hypothetical protein